MSYTGLVPDRRLRELYATASYLLMPSLDEGYGLPALEGIAARIPVVFGDVGPLAEVVGDCGIAVDPTDAGSTADAMRDMVSGSWDEQLAVGSAAARQHTWDDVAARVDRCIRSVAS